MFFGWPPAFRKETTRKNGRKQRVMSFFFFSKASFLASGTVKVNTFRCFFRKPPACFSGGSTFHTTALELGTLAGDGDGSLGSFPLFLDTLGGTEPRSILLPRIMDHSFCCCCCCCCCHHLFCEIFSESMCQPIMDVDCCDCWTVRFKRFASWSTGGNFPAILLYQRSSSEVSISICARV